MKVPVIKMTMNTGRIVNVWKKRDGSLCSTLIMVMCRGFLFTKFCLNMNDLITLLNYSI